jgi:hypothetical protein
MPIMPRHWTRVPVVDEFQGTETVRSDCEHREGERVHVAD